LSATTPTPGWASARPTPTETLSVNGNSFISGRGEFGSFLKLDQIDSGLGAGTVQLCRNAANVIAVCTSSSLRYKQQISPFSGGLDLIRRLRPISFTWKTDGSRDLGLGAEDVAKVEPLLVTHNDKGEIEGVKYDHLNVILISAIKEQQEQITQQRTAARSDCCAPNAAATT
jgi:Chaperone of endosialidase